MSPAPIFFNFYFLNIVYLFFDNSYLYTMFLGTVHPDILPPNIPSPVHIISFYLITDWVQLVSPVDLIHIGNGGCSEITLQQASHMQKTAFRSFTHGSPAHMVFLSPLLPHSLSLGVWGLIYLPH